MKKEIIQFYDDLLGPPGIQKMVIIGEQRRGLKKLQIIQAAQLEYENYQANPGYTPRITIAHRVFAAAKKIPVTKEQVVKRTFKDKLDYWMKYGYWR